MADLNRIGKAIEAVCPGPFRLLSFTFTKAGTLVVLVDCTTGETIAAFITHGVHLEFAWSHIIDVDD